jgi:hypothetical protein
MTPAYALGGAGLAGALAYSSESSRDTDTTVAAVGGAALAGLGVDAILEDNNLVMGGVMVALGLGVALAALRR